MKRRRAPVGPAAAISVEAFNPYEKLFPGRKVVTLEILMLMKELRSQGVTVTVLPDDTRPLEYLFRKGLSDLVKDPMFVWLSQIPIGIACNLISSVIESLRLKWKSVPQVLLCQPGVTGALTPGGMRRDPEWVQGARDQLREIQETFELAVRTGSPFADKPDEHEFTEQDVYLNNDSNSVQRRARIAMLVFNGLLLILLSCAVHLVPVLRSRPCSFSPSIRL